MLVSVFDWKTLNYDYYEIAGDTDHGGWFELQGLGIGGKGSADGVGIDIEDALPSLPLDAQYVSSGKNAKGRIFVKRDAADRGKSSLSGGIPSARLRNLQTIPEKDRIKFHQDRNRHLLDYTGPHFITPGLSGVDIHHSSLNGVALGDSKTSTTPAPEIPSEIPLAMFLVPTMAGIAAGYFAATKTDNISITTASLLGIVGGLTAGIAFGREYESYKQATLRK
jgi:hypothetical protein